MCHLCPCWCAVLDFIDALEFSGSNQPRVGIVAFSGPPIGCEGAACSTENAAPVLLNLTSDYSLARSIIEGRPTSDGLTCISCGIEVGRSVLQDAAQQRDALPIMLLLTDGRQTVDGDNNKAIDTANTVKSDGVVVVAMGYEDADTATMEGMASSPTSTYFIVRKRLLHASHGKPGVPTWYLPDT